MKVEVELTYIGEQTLDGAIINAAAEQIIDRHMRRDEAFESLRERVRSIEDAEIRGRLLPVVEEAVTKAIQPTDHWGAPKGEAMTLAEYITKVATDYLTKETGDYNRRETVVRKFIREEVERQVQAELKKALDEARAQVVGAVKEQAATLMAQTITKMAGVQS